MDCYIEEQISDVVNTFAMKDLSFFLKNKFVRSDMENRTMSSLLYMRPNLPYQQT